MKKTKEKEFICGVDMDILDDAVKRCGKTDGFLAFITGCIVNIYRDLGEVIEKLDKLIDGENL